MKIKLFFIPCCIFFLNLSIYGQSPTIIQGTVLANDSSAAIGATITIQETNTGTVCDFYGNYILEIPSHLDSFVLKYHYIGFYEKKFIFIKNSESPSNFIIKPL